MGDVLGVGPALALAMPFGKIVDLNMFEQELCNVGIADASDEHGSLDRMRSNLVLCDEMRYMFGES